MTRYGMLIDLNKCIGCDACTVACKVANGTPAGVFWNKVTKTMTGTFPNVSSVIFPRPCMHCDDPACVAVCPTGASHKREDGIVLVDYSRCIGCKYCIAACPYGVRTFVSELASNYPGKSPSAVEQLGFAKLDSGVVQKCTFCYTRVEQGLQPACVQTCPGEARTFGDLDDPSSDISKMITKLGAVQVLPEMGTNPSVYYVPSPKGATLFKK